eukprot:SAG11_NODE_2170_length_3724_cov_2.188690_4_plen_75_part_00
MGTSLFRMGGSFCAGNNYFWKRWRGLPWTRPSAAAAWGHDFEGGWGPFEMVCLFTTAGFCRQPRRCQLSLTATL